MKFTDRENAAYRLIDKLSEYRGRDPLILAIPRGAVPMGMLIADSLDGELDVILVHKFTSPIAPEYALGSVTEDGEVLLGRGARDLGLDEEAIEEAASREIRRLQQRRQEYSPLKPPTDPKGRIVIVVDDGIATGATMAAAVQALKHKGAEEIIVAAPVASPEAVEVLKKEGVKVCVIHVPEMFWAVSQFYEDFEQVEDDEVTRILSAARRQASRPGTGARRRALTDAMSDTRPKEIAIPVADDVIRGWLTIPERPKGVVVFAHGSGSGRSSPRNTFVAHVFQESGLATLLMDLLTPEESLDRRNVFDISLLADRVRQCCEWLRDHQETHLLPIGLFGASTGAGAALQAAAEIGRGIQAVVSRGGRPDLAQNLARVKAPVLLIVGERDEPVIEFNEQAMRELHTEKELVIVPMATHLFEEPGTLEEVARLSSLFFSRHLGQAPKFVDREAPRDHV